MQLGNAEVWAAISFLNPRREGARRDFIRRHPLDKKKSLEAMLIPCKHLLGISWLTSQCGEKSRQRDDLSESSWFIATS